jgi:hypothetical protein
MNYIIQAIMDDTLLQLIQKKWEFGKDRVNVFILVDSETVHSSMDRKYLRKFRNKRPDTKTLIYADSHSFRLCFYGCNNM